MSGSRILIVDDDPLIRDAIGGVLENAGYDVDTHDSGFGLALAIREYRPELVLLDVTMPGLRGDSALRALDSLSHSLPNIRVVLFSGIPVDELHARAKRLGVPCLHKPIDADSLLEFVRGEISKTAAAV